MNYMNKNEWWLHCRTEYGRHRICPLASNDKASILGWMDLDAACNGYSKSVTIVLMCTNKLIYRGESMYPDIWNVLMDFV